MTTADRERVHTMSRAATGCLVAFAVFLAVMGAALLLAGVGIFRADPDDEEGWVAAIGVAAIGVGVIGVALIIVTPKVLSTRHRSFVVSPNEIVDVDGRRRNTLSVAHVTRVESRAGLGPRAIVIDTPSASIRLASSGLQAFDTRAVLRDVLAVLPPETDVDPRVRAFVETGDAAQLRTRRPRS